MSAALTALSLRAARDSRASVLRSDRIRLDVAATLAHVAAIAEKLAAAGVQTLALAADNSTDWVLVDLAAQQAGVTVVPLPPFFSREQVSHVLRDSGVDAIAADEFGSAALLSLPTRFACELTADLTLLHLQGGMTCAPLPTDAAKISYTSGTTGTPKGVCLRQETLDRVAYGLREQTRDIGIERHLCLLPLATLLENVAGVAAPIIAGAEVIVPSLAQTGLAGASGFSVRRMLECIDTYQPESIILLPQMLAGLVGAVEGGASLPESLRFAAVGGGVVGLPLLERADQAGIPVFEGYGLTECGSVVALNTPAARRRGSVGRPLPTVQVTLGPDAEVLVGGTVMDGYLGDEPLGNGVIATGDIGRLDADGFLYISGRRKNVLITSFGRNLSPEWVEASLTAGRSIAQAALFGDAMPWNVAVIVPAAAAGLSDIEQEIEAINADLPDYARVRRWILADEAFSPANGEATANGRLCRAAIERHYCNDIAACYAAAIESYA